MLNFSLTAINIVFKQRMIIHFCKKKISEYSSCVIQYSKKCLQCFTTNCIKYKAFYFIACIINAINGIVVPYLWLLPAIYLKLLMSVSSYKAIIFIKQPVFNVAYCKMQYNCYTCKKLIYVIYCFNNT